MKALYRPSAMLPNEILSELCEIQGSLSTKLDIIDLVALTALEGRERGFAQTHSAIYPRGVRDVRNHLINLFYIHEDTNMDLERDTIKKAAIALNDAGLVLMCGSSCPILSLSDRLEAAIFSDWVKP